MSRRPRSQEDSEKRKQQADAFRDAYNKIPRGIYLDVKDELLREFGWSQSLLYMRLSGERKIKETEIPIIKMIFAKYEIDVF